MNNNKRFRIVPLHEESTKNMYNEEWLINQNKDKLDHSIIIDETDYSITRDINYKIQDNKAMLSLKQNTLMDSGFIDFGTIEYNSGPDQIKIHNCSINILNQIISIPELEINLGHYPNEKDIVENVYLQVFAKTKEIYDENDPSIVTQVFEYLDCQISYFTSNDINLRFLEGADAIDHETEIPIGTFSIDNYDKGLYHNEYDQPRLTHAIPLFIIRRRNDGVFSEENWYGSISRPENSLTSSSIFEEDIIDIRHKININNNNWDLVLKETLDKLFRGDLRTKQKKKLKAYYYGSNKHDASSLGKYYFYQSFKDYTAETGQKTLIDGTKITDSPTNNAIELLTGCKNNPQVTIKDIKGNFTVEFYLLFNSLVRPSSITGDEQPFKNNQGILELVCSDGTIFGAIVFDADDNRLEFFSYENKSINKYYTTFAMTNPLNIDGDWHLVTLKVNRNNNKVEFYIDGKLNNISYHEFHLYQDKIVNKLTIGKVKFNESATFPSAQRYIYSTYMIFADLAIIPEVDNPLILADNILLTNGDLKPVVTLNNLEISRYVMQSSLIGDIVKININGTDLNYIGKIKDLSSVNLTKYNLNNLKAKYPDINFDIYNYENGNTKYTIYTLVDTPIIGLTQDTISNDYPKITLLHYKVPYQGVAEYIDFDKDIVLCDPIGIIGCANSIDVNNLYYNKYNKMSSMLPMGLNIDNYVLENRSADTNDIILSPVLPGVEFIDVPLELTKPNDKYTIGNDYMEITSLAKPTKLGRGYESIGLFKRSYDNNFLFKLNKLDTSKYQINSKIKNHCNLTAMLVYCKKYDEVVLLLNTNYSKGLNINNPYFSPDNMHYSAADVFFLEDRPLIKNLNLDGYYNSYYQKTGNSSIINSEEIKVWKWEDWLNPMKEWYPADDVFPSDINHIYPMMEYDDRIKYIELCKNGLSFFRKYRTEQIDAPTNIVNTIFKISSDEIIGSFDEIKIYGGDIASDALYSGALLDSIKININITDNVTMYITRKDIKGW